MKKFIYITGIILVNMFVIGTVFKMFHWPGAGVLIVFGLTLFTLAFLPLVLIHNYKQTGKKKTFLYITGFLCALLCFTGAMFKIMHWPGAGVLLILSTPLPFVLFLPVYIYHNRKHEAKQSLNFIGVMLLLVYVAVFSSLMALNISRDILNSMNGIADNFSQSTNTFQKKNTAQYQTIGESDTTGHLTSLKTLNKKTDELCEIIESVKKELILKIDRDNPEAYSKDGMINFYKLNNSVDNHFTNIIMNGNDGNFGRAYEIKKFLEKYRTFALSCTEDKNVKDLISSILNTSDQPSLTQPEKTDSWQERMFPAPAYMITVLGNLNSIQASARITESVIQDDYKLNK
ncbi:MAG: hypothetical protein V2A54_04990 [Bacteroidota bacterium]